MARLVFVHAHPDDETLATGIALAHHAALGHEVHVVTATLFGEMGEIIPPELAHLGADRDDSLGPYRAGELAGALSALGVHGHQLGGAGTYRDSGMVLLAHGMAGMPPVPDPRSLVAADLDQAAARLTALLGELDPDVVVTYDRGGGYGHPDHIVTRRLVERAVAAGPAGRAVAAYEVVVPRSWAREDRTWLAGHVPPDSGLQVPTLQQPYPVAVVDDDLVTHVVVDEGALATPTAGTAGAPHAGAGLRRVLRAEQRRRRALVRARGVRPSGRGLGRAGRPPGCGVGPGPGRGRRADRSAQASAGPAARLCRATPPGRSVPDVVTEPLDEDAFRRAFGRFATGVAVATCIHGGLDGR